jgi:hypothetical protein
MGIVKGRRVSPLNVSEYTVRAEANIWGMEVVEEQT